MSVKRWLLLSLFLCVLKVHAQLCGGSFGDPIFVENFGSTTSSVQSVAPPLAAPASTSYGYVSSFPPNDGQYTIANRTGNTNWGWTDFLDHTADASGTYGNMLVVNASYTAGEFYRRRISGLCSNQVYRFSAWILNIHTDPSMIRPNVTMQIRKLSGEILGEFSTGDMPPSGSETWKNFYVDFVSDPGSSDVDVVMINNAPGGIGNDLAIDDITFQACGPSTSVNTDFSQILSGVCDNSASFELNAELDSNPFFNVRYFWQKSLDGGLTWTDISSPSINSSIVIAGGSYQNNDRYRFVVGEQANLSSPNCRISSAPVTVKVFGYPVAPPSTVIPLCRDTGSYSVPASGANLLWYSSATGGTGNSVAPSVDLSVVGSHQFWVTQTVSGCESARSLITVNVKDNPAMPLVSNFAFCQFSSGNSISAVGTDLLYYEQETGGTGSVLAPDVDSSVPKNYSVWVNQTVNGCESARAKIDVEILPAPFSSTLADVSICDGESVTLDAGSGFSSYLWNTVPPSTSQSITVHETGDYSVLLTNDDGCSATQTVKVSFGDSPVISKINGGIDFLEVIVENSDSGFLYSLNGVDWQPSPRFDFLAPGIYTVYVKSSIASCITTQDFSVVEIPNVITPNGDGVNDYFRVANIDFFPEAQLLVFDRFGKILFSSDESGKMEWDGSYLRSAVSSGTYWFTINLGNGTLKSGWILVKTY